MASQRYSVTRVASAPRETVWTVVSEAAGWKNWAGVIRSSLEREGDPPPDGVGAIRHLGLGFLGSREEVVEWESPSHLGYVILSGMLPVRNYRADVFLEQTGPATTLIRWSGTFDPVVPGTGALMRSVLHAIISRFAKRAARYAKRQVA